MYFKIEQRLPSMNELIAANRQNRYNQKFILDALQKQGILINDNRRYVRQIYHKVIDDDKDYVEVYMEKEG